MNIYYNEITVVAKGSGSNWLTTQRNDFGFIGYNVFVKVKTASASVELSFTGQTSHGDLGGTGEPTELRLEDIDGGVQQIFLRSASGGEKIQVWSW